MRILFDDPLQARNTLALNARARALVSVASDEQLQEALAWARREQLPVLPLGEGSNVVFAGDLDGLVVCMATRGIEVLAQCDRSVSLRIAAGENWHALVGRCLDRGWYGLENLALIPGTAGAAPVQNIGAYGVELAPLVEAVHTVAVADGESRTLTPAECAFGYRDSVFKGRWRDSQIITALDLRLSLAPRVHTDYPVLARALEQRQLAQASPRDVYDAVIDIRRSRLPDPAREPNAGSFFKNPVIDAGLARDLARQFPGLPEYPQSGDTVKLPAAWLIDYCGWKGYRGDGVGVHTEHALVLVNLGGNSGDKLLALAAEIVASVRDTFGIELEIEPGIYGQRQ